MAEPIERVWILAAATGGPQAVRGVLAGLSDNHPAVFLLAQQVGEEFADVLLDQLAGSTALRVRRAVSGERARRGDVLVVEAGQAVGLDRSGIVRTQADMAPVPLESVLCDAAAGFGARAGAIIFSGVSVELLDALRDLRDQGGEVWVQDPATCLVGALAEAAAEAGVATFVGSPDELAERLAAQAGEPGPRSPLSRG
jgi:chemotaxis response regulator CheB